MMGNKRDTYTDRNKFAQYQVKSRHYKWLLLITEKFLKKPYQFHKYALAYLRKGRYAPCGWTWHETKPVIQKLSK